MIVGIRGGISYIKYLGFIIEEKGVL